jgi:hypothetical protein
MDEFNENEIAKLLRLKRHEQPPPGYFENFLHEFHRRQRDELVCEPLWRILLERAQDFMFRLNVRSLTSYPAAITAALQSQPTLSTAVNAEGEWTLASPVATRIFRTQPLRNLNESAHTHRAATPPRYVLDSVPVSYEPTFRF